MVSRASCCSKRADPVRFLSVGLLAADLAADAATTVDDLAATLGTHAGTETYSAAAFDVTNSSWVVNGHRQISKIPDHLWDSGSDCSPCHSKGLARIDEALDNLNPSLDFGAQIDHTTHRRAPQDCCGYSFVVLLEMCNSLKGKHMDAERVIVGLSRGA